MHSKIYNSKKAKIELDRLKDKHGSTTSYRLVFELQEVAEMLGLPSSSKTAQVLVSIIVNSQRFVDMSEEELCQLPISGRTERLLIKELKLQKSINYSFIKEIESL